MSAFNEAEIAYLKSQRLGRLATVGRDSQPHVMPVGYRYNAENDTIDIGGPRRPCQSARRVRDRRHRLPQSVEGARHRDPWRSRGARHRRDGARPGLRSGDVPNQTQADHQLGHRGRRSLPAKRALGAVAGAVAGETCQRPAPPCWSLFSRDLCLGATQTSKVPLAPIQ